MQSAAADTFDSLMAQGVKLRSERKYAQLYDCYKRALQLNPKKFTEWQLLGESCYRTGRDQEALKYLSRAIEASPKDGYAYDLRYHTYINLHDYEKALPDCKKCLEYMPGFFVPQKDLVTLYRVLGRRKEAMEADALFKKQNLFQARELMRKEKYKEAIAEFTSALNSKDLPEMRKPQALEMRGECFGAVGDYKSAKKDLDEAIKLRGTQVQPIAHVNRGLVLLELERYKEAIADLSIVLETKSRSSWAGITHTADEVLYKRATAYFKLKEYRRAIGDCGRSLELDDSKKETYKLRGDCHFALGEFQPAIDDYTKAIEMDKEEAAAIYLARSRAYEKLGNSQKAQKDGDRARELGALKKH